MAAETLNCPMCGASASSESTRCAHCGARLATISCPSCFGMMFLGAKFCSHCGAKADRKERDDNVPHPCPRCQEEMRAITLGNTDLRECPKCEGIWADTASVNRICADRERQVAVLGVAEPMPNDLKGNLEEVRYRPCPVCRQLMHRVNFARCSQVVVDVCRAHGTWFDRDELRRIVEFIQRGGMDNARRAEIRELERRKRDLESIQYSQKAMGFHDAPLGLPPDLWLDGISTAASVLKTLLR